MRPLKRIDYDPPRRFLARIEAGRPPSAPRRLVAHGVGPGVDVQAVHTEQLFVRRVTVFRSYLVLRTKAEGPDEHLLMDGAHGSIAGRLSLAEARRFLRVRKAEPKTLAAAPARRATAVVSRCPHCGADKKVAARVPITVCVNCGAACRWTATGPSLLPSLVDRSLEPPAGLWIPFWRFGFDAALDGETHSSLEGWLTAVFPKPTERQLGPALLGSLIYVPAIDLLRSGSGQEAFSALMRSLHSRNQRLERGRVEPAPRVRVLNPTLDAAEGQGFARAAFVAALGDERISRLSTQRFKKDILGAALTTRDPELVFFGFHRRGQMLERLDLRANVAPFEPSSAAAKAAL